MANLIPQEKITEIQHAVDIVQIISEFVQLKQQGRNFTGLCPFHSEKTPSFTVNPEKKNFLSALGAVKVARCLILS